MTKKEAWPLTRRLLRPNEKTELKAIGVIHGYAEMTSMAL
jgi:hypothetical protein